MLTLFKSMLRRRHDAWVAISRLYILGRGRLFGAANAKLLMRLSKEELFPIQPLQTISSRSPDCHERVGTISIPPVDIVCIEGAHLVPPDIGLLDSRYLFIAEQTGSQRFTALTQCGSIKPLCSVLSARFSKAESFNGDWYVVSSPFYCNYYHWVMDCLPMLYHYESLAEIGFRAELMLPSYLSEVHIQYLEKLGYSKTNYSLFAGKHLRVSRLILPTWHKFAEGLGPPSLRSMQWLRQRLLPQVKDILGEGRYIFVSRQDSSKTRIDNEAEILVMLEGLGFHTVCLARLPLEKQIAIFRDAEVIVATHGAGLTNLLFSNNPTVIEIFEYDKYYPYFKYILDVIGGCHHAYFADQLTPIGRSQVQVACLRQALIGVLTAKSS